MSRRSAFALSVTSAAAMTGVVLVGGCHSAVRPDQPRSVESTVDTSSAQMRSLPDQTPTVVPSDDQGPLIELQGEVLFDVPRIGCVQLRVGTDKITVWDAVGPLLTDDHRAGSLPVRYLKLAGRISPEESKCVDNERHQVFRVSAIVGIEQSASDH